MIYIFKILNLNLMHTFIFTVVQDGGAEVQPGPSRKKAKLDIPEVAKDKAEEKSSAKTSAGNNQDQWHEVVIPVNKKSTAVKDENEELEEQEKQQQQLQAQAAAAEVAEAEAVEEEVENPFFEILSENRKYFKYFKCMELN